VGGMQALWERVGAEIGVSDWVVVDQRRVDRHAETTGDAQWIHNDPERARREGPFGAPIAQGFLLLSLFTALAEQALPPVDGIGFLVNYGFDRIRFLRPVPVGSRVRLRLRLDELRDKGPGRRIVVLDATLEAEGESAPALAATWLFLAQEAETG
jgi:acyl dehydratase